MPVGRTTPRALIALVALLALLALPWFATADEPRPYPLPPAWVADQTLYEVNLRHFSKGGQIDGLLADLPRLHQLGVGTVWVMPVNPIGEKGRSGHLGSPYAVRDYKAFNPEFGDLQTFKATVDAAHRLGMHVILDWVANHTALDHPWVAQHPDWYKHDAEGKLVPPVPAWADVAALDFGAGPMRREMIDAMAFWVRETGVDGFRCDTAEFVPLDFWVEARDALRAIKPVFLLAEGVRPDLTRYAFDASYAWNLPPNMEGIAKGTKSVADLVSYLNADAKDLAGGGFRLNFTSNHDKNAWEGTTKELLKGGEAAFAVLTFTLPGMPLIHNGQEAGDEKRLAFFDRDPIAWHADPMADLYRKLAELKRGHAALWNGPGQGPARVVAGSTTDKVLCFERGAAGDTVTVLLNLSDAPQTVAAPAGVASMRPALGDAAPVAGGIVSLKPWEYRVWTGGD